MYNNSLYVNPTIRNFWINLKKRDEKFHVFKNNRNLVFFGDKLSKDSFDYINDRLKKINVKYDINEIHSVFFTIKNKEQEHSEILREIAIKTVSEILDIPEHMLDAKINEHSRIELNNSKNKKNYNYESLTKEIKDQINKRILLNCIIQGSSIHSFYTLHHFAKKEIDNIDPTLIRLYDEFSAGSARSYYSIDYSSIVAISSLAQKSAIGSVKVEYQNENPKIVANAISFPVLCQELVKGVMEMICLHGLQNINKNDLDKIYYFADDIQNEPMYIQIGTSIWRNVLEINKILLKNNKINLPELIMKISTMKPNEIEDFFEKMNENDLEEAAQLIY